MRLSRLEIKNHSRIQDLKVNIRRHAVIVGPNDVGKSSILRILNLLLGSTTAGLYQALSPADIRDRDEPLVVNALWSDITEKNRAAFPWEISIGGDKQSEYLWVQMTVAAQPEDEDGVTVQRWFPEGGHRRAPSKEQLEEFGWRYLRANRGTSLMEGSHSPVRTLLAAADLGSNEVALRDLLTRFNDELAGNESVGELLERVAAHLTRAMPKSVTRDDISVRSATDPTSDVLQDVSLFLQRDGEQISLQEQSDGARQLMSMTLFDLAEGAANVLAIDEPELHLHPTSQRTASDLLSGPGNQKIIVTHSPYVLHRFEPSEVVAIDRNGVCHQVGDSALSRVEKARAQWWSPRILEALTARVVVLVEGDADRVIVEGVAHTLKIDLDRLGAVVLELGGADKFKNVFPLLGPDGFGATILGLVDEKESPAWVGRFTGTPETIVDQTVFISAQDLEDEYTRALGGPAAAQALIDGGVCREQGIIQAAGVSGLADLSPEAVAAFCRRDNRKVDAASAVVEVLNPALAEQIGSVSRLLRRLEDLSKR